MDWLSIADGSHLPHIWHGLLAQVPTPSPNAAGQVDLLRQQLEFLAKENARQGVEFTEKMKLLADENQKLSESFKTFITAFSLLSGGAVAALAVLFGKTLKEAQDSVDGALNRKVETALTGRLEEVSEKLEVKLSNLKRTLQKEEVVGSTLVDYWLFGAEPLPIEYTLLVSRGFRSVRPRRNDQALAEQCGDVVVLDLENWVNAAGQRFPDVVKDEREQEAERQVNLLMGMLPKNAVLVVYTRSVVTYLYNAPKTRLMSPANNPVTLVGMVSDAAYISAGAR
jgi:hypothetical protein